MGTLGSGNHYLEVQHVAKIFDNQIASSYGLQEGYAVLNIHCGSRGLGHQIGTEFLTMMAVAASQYGIELPDRELALRADQLPRLRKLLRGDEGCDQLRPGQSADHHPPGEAGL